MHFIAYSSLWFPFLLHLDWHKLCNMVALISAPGGQAAGWKGIGDGERSVGSVDYRNLILFVPTEAFESWLRLCVCRCMSIRTHELLTTRLTRRSSDPARTSAYPKSWPSCTDTFTADINTTHTNMRTHGSNDAGNLILIVLHSLHWLMPVTCLCSKPIRSHSLNDTKDIFIPSTCCWEAFCKNCVRVDVGSYWVAVYASVRMHVCVVWNWIGQRSLR